MKILLVYPELPVTFWSYKHMMKFFRKKSVSPPLGLLTAAAMLPAEWPKRLVDMNVTELEEKDLLWADYAFISAMSFQLHTARDVIERCRKAKLKIVAGGPLFTSQYQEVEGVDHFVLNEAEITLPLFLEDIKRNAAKHVYKTSEFADLSKSPAPLWELADMKQYFEMGIQTSRGCPYDCEFCEISTLFGHKHRMKSASQVMSELQLLYDLGWRTDVFIGDDNFVGNKRRLKTELMPELIKWQKGKGLRFDTQASIDLADDEELMNMMAAAGFDLVFVGIETPDQDSLIECDKKHNKNRDFISDVNRMHQAGIRVFAGFVIGFDNDTPSIFQRQIDLIQKAGIVAATVTMLQALPGTKLYKRLKAEGRLIVGKEILYGNLDDIESVNFTPAMGREVLGKGYKEIIKYLYSSVNYYQRVKTCLLKYKTSQKIQSKTNLSLRDAVGLFHSVFHLGVIDKDRFHYWKFLLWTIVKRPNLLFDGVLLALLGYHYRKYYNIE